MARQDSGRESRPRAQARLDPGHPSRLRSGNSDRQGGASPSPCDAVFPRPSWRSFMKSIAGAATSLMLLFASPVAAVTAVVLANPVIAAATHGGGNNNNNQGGNNNNQGGNNNNQGGNNNHGGTATPELPSAVLVALG